MFFHSKEKEPISCPVSVVFDIISCDLELGICSDVAFIFCGRKHQAGAWGDDGETKKNVRYYLDSRDFSTMEELKQTEISNGISFASITEWVRVTECDGCYPLGESLLKSQTKG